MILIDWVQLTHFRDISHYNYNLYELPQAIRGCNVLLESYDGGDYFNGYSIGRLRHGVYTHHWYLNADDADGGVLIIDPERISEINGFA